MIETIQLVSQPNSCPAWRLQGFLRPGLYAELLASFLSHQHKLNDPSKFGGKLSLEHKSPLGSSLFCDPPFIELANFLISSSFLKTVFSLLRIVILIFGHISTPYSASPFTDLLRTLPIQRAAVVFRFNHLTPQEITLATNFPTPLTACLLFLVCSSHSA